MTCACALLASFIAWGGTESHQGDCISETGTLPCPEPEAPALMDEQRVHEDLQRVRTHIDDVNKTLDDSERRSHELQRQLREKEIAATDALEKLQGLDGKIAAQQSHLAELTQRADRLKDKTANERRMLSQLLYSSTLLGRNEHLKLLLRQEESAMLGRVLAWHGYHRRMRAERVAGLREKLDELSQVRRELSRESGELEALQARHQEKAESYREFRASRERIIAKLDERMERQGRELTLLREEEKRLKDLLNEVIERNQENTENEMRYADLPAFSSLRGDLEWPVDGKLTYRFGQLRNANTNIKWNGVLLSAAAGEQVRVIGHGRVIYADWLRGLGWLIVVDHGESYISLYGHNQRLLKKKGDWTLAGEPIATVGDSGGQGTPGVYFEIRLRTKALNPTQWCKAR